ncbi:MAG: reverse transcriptase domain-containing protein [Aeromonas sp.]
MGSSKRISNNKSYKDARSASSNLGGKPLNDDLKSEMVCKSELTTANVNRKTHYVSGSLQMTVFKRNMSRKEVLLELFLIESEENFEKRSLKSQIAEVAKRGDDDFKDWFFDKITNNDFPNSWEEFSNVIVKFCTNRGLDNIEKFNDEKWSSYLTRLGDFCKLNNLSEEDIFKKLRKEYSPQNLQNLFYAFDQKLEDVIKRVIEYENFKPVDTGISKKFKRKYNENVRTERNALEARKYDRKSKDEIQCYNCKKFGHYSNECTESKKQINKINNKIYIKNESNIDERKVRINNKEFNVIFDTGAAVSMITSRMLKYFKSSDIIDVDKEFCLFNGVELHVKRAINLTVEYENKKHEEIFYIAEMSNNESILLSNNLVKKFENKYEIPIKCVINTKDICPISAHRPIKSLKDKLDFQEMISELEKKGVVEESTSQWLNPVVLVRKKNGSLRFCMDFRKLNEAVELDHYEIPRINQLVTSLRDQKYFSSIDLKDGFYHIDIVPTDRCKTAFYTGKKLMQFKKMPQGYKNSPATFQRAMDYIFKDIINEICIVYIDDILVFGRTEDEHDKNFEKVVDRIKEYKLQENLEKRIFKVEKIEFLGYEISHNQIKPTLTRCQGIIDYKEPKNRKELQRFLGFINYDRNFVKNISDHLCIFYRLLQKDTPFNWGERERLKFIETKNLWQKNLNITMPDYTKQFVLETDASQTGLGACLSQNENTIVYISRSLTKAEKNYGITEKEVLGALWAMEKLQYFLLGKKFILKTDHKATEYINKKIDFGSARISRWFERFSRFQFDVVYKKGSEIIAADALSRSNDLNENSKEIHANKVYVDVMKLHNSLNHRKNIMNEVRKEKIIIPIEKMKEIIGSCETCLRKDKLNYRTCKHVETTQPGEVFAVDLLEIEVNQKVILGIDYFSRMLFGKMIKTKESHKILEFLQTVYKKFPFKRLLTDNGKEFKNELIEKWTNENEIIHDFSIPYYHQGNGRIERANRTIREAIKKTPGLLKVKLEGIIKNYNNLKHRAIGCSPIEALREDKRKMINEHTKKYAKEFNIRKGRMKSFEVGDSVIIKNEFKTKKMQDEFVETGIVKEVIRENKYLIKLKKGNDVVRHATQLKLFKDGEVVTNDVLNIQRGKLKE